MRKIVALLVVAPALASASGYSLPNTNPRDLSLSASAVAAQRDSGAAFALPAALARLRGPYVSVGVGNVNVFNDWTDPSATPNATPPPYVTPLPPTPATPAEPMTEDMDLTHAVFPNVSVAYGGTLPMLGDRGWGVGLGLQPFGGARVDWPDDWAGRYRITKVDRRVFSGILSAGIEVIPQVRIGGGVMYYRTWQTLEQKAWMEPFAPPGPFVPGAPDATGDVDMSGGAFTYSVSTEIEPLKGVPLTFAVDYKHKATQELDGDVKWTGISPFFSGPVPAALEPLQDVYTATSAEQQLTIPNLLNVGVAYRLIRPLLVTATFTFDRWVVYDRDRLVANTGGVIDVPRNYRNGQTYRAGVEYDVSRTWQLRAGVQRDVSGLRTSTYSPTLPDASSWAGSLGATYRFGRGFSVDAAVFYANMDEVESTNNGLEPGLYATVPGGVLPVPQPGSTFRGRYEPQAFVYALAVGWTPGTRTE